MTERVEKRFRALLEEENNRRNSKIQTGQAEGLRQQRLGDGFGGRFYDPSEAIRDIKTKNMEISVRT